MKSLERCCYDRGCDCGCMYCAVCAGNIGSVYAALSPLGQTIGFPLTQVCTDVHFDFRLVTDTMTMCFAERCTDRRADRNICV